ncbi:MAG: metal ABC transporter permease, partial [Bacillota bacterium]
GCVCPAVGVFLVLRRYSFLAETLAHVSLAGLAIGLLLGILPFAATFFTAVIAAVAVEILRARKNLYNDALLALAMSGGLALAVVLFSYSQKFGGDVMGYLFGSILTLTPDDLWLITAVAALVLAAVAFLYKELYFISFDEECARVAGLPVQKINFVFIFLVAGTVSVAVRVVGALLVGALMVIPVLIALLLAGSFGQAFRYAVGTGVAVTLAGLIASYYLGTASGGTIVLLAVALFVLVLAGGRVKGFLQKRPPCRFLAAPTEDENSRPAVRFDRSDICVGPVTRHGAGEVSEPTARIAQLTGCEKNISERQKRL